MTPSKTLSSSTARKESPSSQKRHANRNRFIWTLVSWNDNFNTAYNRKVLLRKRPSILDEIWLNYDQLFPPVQCTAWKISQSHSIVILNLPRASSNLSISDQFLYLWGINCFINSTRLFRLVCISQEFYTHFFPTIGKNQFLESLFSVSSNCCVSITVCVSYSEEVFGVLITA